MNQNQTSPKPPDDEQPSGKGLDETPCSLPLHSLVEGIPLPNQHDGIERLVNRDGLKSWIPKGANLVFGSDLAPGLDFVIKFEQPRCRPLGATTCSPSSLPNHQKTMNPHEISTARISLRWHGSDIVKEVQIDPHQARCLAPLHKDHDFPGMPYAYRDAMNQREERRALATAIASALTNAIMEEVAAQDPRNGEHE